MTNMKIACEKQNLEALHSWEGKELNIQEKFSGIESRLIHLLDRIRMQYGRMGMMLIQTIVTILFYAGAFLLRFEFSIPSKEFHSMVLTVPLLALSRAVAFHYYRVEAGGWRFVSTKDLATICKATFWGSVAFVVLVALFFRLEEFPRSILLLEPILNLLATGGIRFLIRVLRERDFKTIAKPQKQVLIIGAEKAGVLVLNEIRSNPKLRMRVMGFVDDNRMLQGLDIQNMPVLGETKDLPQFVKKYEIEEIIVASPSARYKDIAKVQRMAQETGVRVKILPDLGRIIQEGAFRGILKEISYEELLGRKPVVFRREGDIRLLEKEIKNKAILITGAGGSIGSELCKHVASFGPRLLIAYDRYENTLYRNELGLRKQFPTVPILPVIGDILDRKKLGELLEKNKVDLIYHAAAYKHVPLMERDPLEAIRNNVLGTWSVAQEAIAKGVDKFIMVSTDKAVNPTSIMGITKRAAERTVQALDGKRTKFISVRFGNVIGSDGSVIPIFKKQIMEGGPVTVTHPEVKRYFMSTSEAVQLVMTAGTMGKGGEIFLLDMGEQVKIVDVARKMIEYMGLNPDKDVDIQFVGLRPGEKLYEELYWKGEGIVPTENKKITLLRPKKVKPEEIFEKIQEMVQAESAGESEKAVGLLKRFVPEAKIQEKDL